jgi:hypothetical protein
LQLIRDEKAGGLIPSTGASSATFIYAIKGVVLRLFMQNSQITTEMEASDWLKLSELAGARANAGAAAAERIVRPGTSAQLSEAYNFQ